jgi:hypothetical protein
VPATRFGIGRKRLFQGGALLARILGYVGEPEPFLFKGRIEPEHFSQDRLRIGHIANLDALRDEEDQRRGSGSSAGHTST